MSDPHRLEDIKAELGRDVGAALHALGVSIPNRARKARYYLMSSPLPGRTDKNPSFAIYHSGSAAGNFKDFSTGEQGSLLDLAMALGAARDIRDARVWALKHLGWDTLGAQGLSEIEMAQKRQANRERQERQRQAEQKELKRARGSVFYEWTGAQADLRGTPVADYLERHRGIPLESLPKVPGCLRYAVADYYPKTTDGRTSPRFPAMLALISGPDGSAYGVHRTFLQPRTHTKLQATPGGGPARKVWPDYGGGVIRLSKGDSKLSPERANKAVLDGDLRHARPVILTEGVEDGLVNMMAAPMYRIWAAVSLSNLMNVPDMPCVSEWIVWQDNDWDKPQAQAGFQAAIARLQAFGKPVRIIAPKNHKDANDLLLAHRREKS